MRIDNLYFGITLVDPNTNKPKACNLFGSMRVQRSVAVWASMSRAERADIEDGLHFCFGDTRGRSEYECIVCPLITESDSIYREGTKCDAYDLYVKPNAHLLMEMVNKISATEGRRWMRDNER